MRFSGDGANLSKRNSRVIIAFVINEENALNKAENVYTIALYTVSVCVCACVRVCVGLRPTMHAAGKGGI